MLVGGVQRNWFLDQSGILHSGLRCQEGRSAMRTTLLHWLLVLCGFTERWHVFLHTCLKQQTLFVERREVKASLLQKWLSTLPTLICLSVTFLEHLFNLLQEGQYGRWGGAGTAHRFPSAVSNAMGRNGLKPQTEWGTGLHNLNQPSPHLPAS